MNTTTATRQRTVGKLTSELKPTLKTVTKLTTEKVVMGMTITPKMAEEMLKLNTCNRPVNQRTVDYYVKQIKEGKWRLNGECISFSNTNVLIDGQHRLLAIIKSGIAIQSDVRYGLEDDVFPTVNTGRIRQSSDACAIADIENYTHISAMVNFIINFTSGHIDQASRGYSHGSDKITNETVVEFSKKNNKSLEESRVYGYSTKLNDGTLKAKLLASLHYIFKRLKGAEDDANEFFGRVGDGVGLTKDSPIYVLRKLLQADNKNTKHKMNPNHRIALICKAWNIYRKKGKCTRLTVDIIKDGFPKPL